ncbi:MAG: hypothetical protein JWO48_3788 [Bryobacterales bacterium]|nr:hypothetical protein [Bryobacterales bacterium]
MRQRFGSSFLLLGLLIGGFLLAAQNVQVNSAVPNSAAQGTINFNVTVGGNGFKRGAGSKFFVTGTTDTGGVTVNSTAFVSSTQLTANINVSDTATISNFDVVVNNTDGRSGKGTGLFSVKSKGTPMCTLSPLPSQFTLISTLNSGAYTGGLGGSIRIRHIKLGGKDVLVAGVGSSASGKLEVFLLDPATGALLDGTVIGTNTVPQPHITKPITLSGGSTFGARVLAMGDLNADGVPDIAVGDRDYGVAFAFVGSVDANGILSYSGRISFPPATGQSARFGYGLAFGNLDGLAGDEIAVADSGFNGTGGNKQPGGVFIYRFSGGSFALAQIVSQPAFSVAIGDVTGDPSPDFVVSGTSGSTYVYAGPSLSSSLTFASGGKVAVANVDGGPYSDLITSTNSATPSQASVYSGLLSAGQQPAFTAGPQTGLTTGWGNDLDAWDVNGDGLADLFIGAPNTSPPACPSTGNAYVFLTNSATPNQPTRYILEPPTPGGLYAWAIGAAPGTRIFLVGEIGRTINGVTNAGQVYVYRVN